MRFGECHNICSYHVFIFISYLFHMFGHIFFIFISYFWKFQFECPLHIHVDHKLYRCNGFGNPCARPRPVGLGQGKCFHPTPPTQLPVHPPLSYSTAKFHELPILLIFGPGLQIMIYLIILASKARHTNLIDTTFGCVPY